jgi:hypothetical protein
VPTRTIEHEQLQAALGGDAMLGDAECVGAWSEAPDLMSVGEVDTSIMSFNDIPCIARAREAEDRSDLASVTVG